MLFLNVRLFGQLSVSCGDESLDHLIPGKAKELLCYLLTHRQRPVTRESLATILWEDCTTEHSKQYLRKALWQLQRSLYTPAQSPEGVLQVDAQCLSINCGADIWLDIEEFESTCAAAQSTSWWTDGHCLEVLQVVFDLYRGDLLEGWYEDWCLYERERLQNMYLVLLVKFAAYCEGHGEYGKGLQCGARILQFDRAHEVAHQHLMRLLYLAGDRAGALRQYERCAAALKEELGVQPSECTRRLYQQISESELLLGAMPDRNSSVANEGLGPLHSALGGLQNVKIALDALQNAVDDALSRIGRALQLSSHAETSSKDTPR
jgi:DNA-binding SARP family transcriptional activator